jgi:hypothetical protein
MENSKKKILVVTPRFPYPEAGADEQDRAGGIRQLLRLGFDVEVISKVFSWQPVDEIKSFWGKLGVKVTLIPYQAKKSFSFIFDGAAAEYRDPVLFRTVTKTISENKPDLLWCDYTYLWPLFKLARRANLPIVLRSINVESRHFLEEDGQSIRNYIKALPKFLTEENAARGSDVIFSITPYEREFYEQIGAKRAVNLPLRGLAQLIGTHSPRMASEGDSLHVFFSGSTYTVHHNRRALEFIIKEVAPAIWATYGSKFIFHITGAKFPEDLKNYLVNNVVYEGFVPDRDLFLKNMDIALSPSLFGAGMQQKIFEPITRGFPTITHARGIAGYPFSHGEDFLAIETVSDACQALSSLIPFEAREKLSVNAKQKSQNLFSEFTLDSIVSQELYRVMKV